MLKRFTIDRRHRAEFLGCPVDLYGMSETVALITGAIQRRERLQHVVINVAKIVNLRKNALLARDVTESELINADGMGIVWGCRLLGVPVKERVAGADLMMEILTVCEREGFRPYFLGARQDVLDAFIEKIRQIHPDLKIAGWRDGYFSTDEQPEIASQIKAARPDCLFVAISSPIKENFIHTYRDILDIPFLMGIGGTIDVVAGHVSRAPLWMQRCGLEWFYRMAQEPRRLWRRYLFSNAEYALLLFSALLDRLLPRSLTRTKA